MTTARVRAQFRLAGALLGAVMLLAAGCSAGGGGSPGADPAGTAHAAVAVSSPGRAIADRTAGPISGRRDSGSRIAWAPSLPRCSYAAGAPAPARTGAASGRQARISRVGDADLGGQAAAVHRAMASCVRPAPAAAKCPRNPHVLIPCRET